MKFVKSFFTIAACSLLLLGCAQVKSKFGSMSNHLNPAFFSMQTNEKKKHLIANQGGLNTQSLAAMHARLPVSEWNLAQKALITALFEVGDGDSVSWHNPEQKTVGIIKPVAAISLQENVCRNFITSLKKDETVSAWSGAACRGQDKVWVLTKFEPDDTPL